jgi:hypothetical protein
MKPTETTAESRAFCSDCGTRLDVGGRFCHQCGAPIAGGARHPAAARGGLPRLMAWSVPALALVALVALVAANYGARTEGPAAGTTGMMPLGAGSAPDISSLTPEERADRLFNRVMRLDSEGHADSAAFFATMALGAFEALAPLTAHHRYDIGLIALVSGNGPLAKEQADAILRERPTHLLGLSLAARAAEAQGDAVAAATFRRRLVAVEPEERKAGLVEYIDHDSDIVAAVALGRAS